MSVHSPTNFFQTRRGRLVIENLTAYLFLFPAGLIIFLFGLFPVGFAFFVSLHEWRRFPEEFIGLDNYVRALGSFAYVVFFWLALGLLLYALFILYRQWRHPGGHLRDWLMLPPGALNAAALTAVAYWFFTLLPVILDIPQRIRGQQRATELFVSEFFASFQFPQVVAAGNTALLLSVAALALTAIFLRWGGGMARSDSLLRFTLAALLAIMGVALLQLTLAEIEIAISEAQADGTELPIWTQIIFISAGAALLFGAYAAWQRAAGTYNDRCFLLIIMAAFLLMLGGYLLVAELPRALSEADDDILLGFNITVMYALGTVPLQLTIGLGLAYLLYQNIKGKAIYRVVYFMPYITPFVATSIVFTLIFSHRTGSPVNQFLQFLGIEPQKWLLEPTGVNRILFGADLPDVLAGPGLALVVIMLYNTWIYAGYSTVIFLAGLGNISGELYEAARIDGATGWRIFRHITLPLLSPTTFFLSLIAIIGTFQAFIQIWLMRTPAAQRAVDTINIYIFQEIQAARPNYAYGSAMAFVLFGVILVLTIAQNRVAGRRVFYG